MNHSQNYDVIIIGGGFAGCALAYHFSRSKIKTLLVEKSYIGSGTSAACAGRVQIFDAESERYLEIIRQGYQILSNLNDELDTDLEWEQPGHITLYKSRNLLDQHLQRISWLKNAGFDAEYIDPSSLFKFEPALQPDDCVGAILASEAHINPFKFCHAYLQAAKRLGATILTSTTVDEFPLNHNRVEAVQAGNYTFSAKNIILATGAWTGSILNQMDINLPLSFTKAEAFISEPLPKLLHHHIGTSGFYESVHGSTKTVTIGIGQHRNGCLLVSNAIHPASEIDRSSTAWGLPAITQQLKQFFPILENTRVIRTWSAPSPFSVDSLPVIGWLPQVENLYLASAFHLAIPTIPIFSKQICQQILNPQDFQTGEFLQPFSPERFVGPFNNDHSKPPAN